MQQAWCVAFPIFVVAGPLRRLLTQDVSSFFCRWEACITNDTLYDTYPRLKLNMHFEYEKTEDDDLRDYRLANETAIVDGFSSALDAFSTRVAWLVSGLSGLNTFPTCADGSVLSVSSGPTTALHLQTSHPAASPQRPCLLRPHPAAPNTVVVRIMILFLITFRSRVSGLHCSLFCALFPQRSPSPPTATLRPALPACSATPDPLPLPVSRLSPPSASPLWP